MTLLGAGTIRPALDYLKSPRVLIGLLSLALLLVLVRLPFYAVPLITDEGAAAYTAIFWSADHQLYRDINYDRPQGFFLVYQLIFALLGDDTVAIRLGAALYSVGTMVAIFLLAQSIGGRLAAWRSGPRNLDSGLSEISIVFQAAVPKPVAPKYTTSGVCRPSEL